jgi:hypothetical protein
MVTNGNWPMGKGQLDTFVKFRYTPSHVSPHKNVTRPKN